eukprot:g13911.t1
MKADDDSSNSVGFVAGGSTGVLGAMTRGTKYKAVVSDSDSYAQAEPGVVQPFEVELMSDVEGEGWSSGGGRGEGVSPSPRNTNDNPWMRDIWSVQNRAVVMSYFCVGFAMRFLQTPLAYYTVRYLEASPAQQNIMLTLASLPWSFKLVYGFISDNFPIWGMRRKPYFIMGWLSYVLINFFTAAKQAPSIQLLAGWSLTSSMGFMLSDVTTDAILVERSKHEPTSTRGSMQAIGYSTRFVGRETAVVSGNIPVKQRLREQCTEVFRALEQKAVYGPMVVVFFYNLLQVPNAAWRSFLVQGLGFKPYKLGILAVISSMMASLGLMAYKRWFFHSSWRKLYVWTTLTVSFFSTFQILLILRVNLAFGISDFVFSIGDDSIADFVQAIQFLPIVQMYISMCPDGAEGTTYAILTTMSNVSMAAAMDLGTMFTGIWDVSNKSLCRGEFTGMWKLTLLTSLIQPLPLFLIRRLPSSQAEQHALQNSGVRNRWGGIVLLSVLFGSLLWTVALSIVELAGDDGADTESFTSMRKGLQQLKDEPNREDSPLTRKIRMLENRLDKAMIKYNEAQSIRKTYEQIVKRLKEERVGFDNQLGAVERTLQAKIKDYEELLLLSGDANHAREVAQSELERLRSVYEEERRRRESELRERHQVVQLRKQIKLQADRRAQMRAGAMNLDSEGGEAGEHGVKKAAAAHAHTTAKMVMDGVSHKTKIDVFENAFRKIKEATGVSDVNEVIQKMVSQESTAESLMILTKENQATIEGLNKRRSALKAAVEEVKYSGPGEGHRRKMVDDHEELLSNSVARLERVRHKHERLSKILISVKAGVEHLQDKLKSTANEVGVEAMVMTDETVVDVLEVAEKVLVEVSERVKLNEYEQSASEAGAAGDTQNILALSSFGGGGGPGSQTDLVSWAGGDGAMAESDKDAMQLRPYNQRIELPDVDDSDGEGGRGAGGGGGGAGGGGGSGDDDGIHDLDEDELTRDKVKKAASHVLLQQEKKKKKPKRKGRGTD